MNIREATNPTKQEMFDWAYNFITAQGRPSGAINGDDFVCAYRAKNNDRCAIGAMMNDKELAFARAHEGQSILGLTDIKLMSPKLRPWFIEHRDFLNDLQRAHDNAAVGLSKPRDPAVFLRDFTKRMEQVASTNGLAAPA